jgi:Restriction endonuclease/DnaJ domain
VGSDTYYEILGVSSTAPQDEVRAKYRKLIQRIHPDLDGPAALFRQVQEAYEVLSDPARRAAYDRALHGGGVPPPPRQKAERRESASTRSAGHSGSGPGRPGATGPSGGSGRQPKGAQAKGGQAKGGQAKGGQAKGGQASRSKVVHSSLSRYPARVVAMAGAVLLVLGAAAMGPASQGLLVLALVALVLAGVAGLGARGAKESEAYQRSGMAAVDTMTGRQFRFLLEHLFAKKGYRVARLRLRRDSGADLLLDLPHGRTIVQVQHWGGMVRHEAVHQVVVAKARYGAARALVVTSSNYSQDAVAVANSHGVMLWNRAALATELSTFRSDSSPSGPKRFSADLRAGTRNTLGFLATLLVTLLASGAKARSKLAPSRHRG